MTYRGSSTPNRVKSRLRLYVCMPRQILLARIQRGNSIAQIQCFGKKFFQTISPARKKCKKRSKSTIFIRALSYYLTIVPELPFVDLYISLNEVPHLTLYIESTKIRPRRKAHSYETPPKARNPTPAKKCPASKQPVVAQ